MKNNSSVLRHLVVAFASLMWLIASFSRAQAQDTVYCSKRPELTVTHEDGRIIDVLYLNVPVVLKCTVLSDDNAEIPASFYVVHNGKEVKPAGKDQTKLTITPKPGTNRNIQTFLYYVRYNKKSPRYCYPEPLQPGLEVKDATGNWIHRNIRWVCVNCDRNYQLWDKIIFPAIRKP